MSAPRPVLFLDRDGTLIAEPPDHQVDRLDKVRLVDGVIPALIRLRDAGYEFVVVTNQDGLGTSAFPRERFEEAQQFFLHLFESQGIGFREMLVDGSLPADNAPTRKPGVGLVLHLMRDRGIDWARSAMVGDRPTDIAFAENLGVRGYQLRTGEFGGQWDWPGIAHALVDAPRAARVERKTRRPRYPWQWTSTSRAMRRLPPAWGSSTTCSSSSASTAGSRWT